MRNTYNNQVRAIIREHADQTITSKFIRDRIEGIGDMAGETLRRLHKEGELRRVNKHGHPEYRLNTSHQRAAQRDPASPARKAYAKANATQQAHITGLARTPRRTSGRALLYSVTLGPSKGHCPKRAASDRIAADIAAFEARGGQVEKLGNTPFFKI